MVLILALLAVQTAPDGFVVDPYGSGISNGTAMAWAPDGRLFVCEQGGAVRVIRNGTLLAAPFHAAPVNFPQGSERGLLGIAVDPGFPANGFVYIYYTKATPVLHNCIRRLQPGADPDVSDGSETVVADLDPLSAATNHNGGALHFGPDGKLYVAVGENGDASHAQSLANRLGKILRYNPDGTIPADNPSVFEGIAGSTAGANRAIWAVGLRNPFTFALQPGTGRMFINDVGETTWEGINEGRAGANYGWEGGATDGPRRLPGFTDPVFFYNYQGGSPTGEAISGGAFYNPSTVRFPASFVGRYFFSDFIDGWIWSLDPASPGSGATEFVPDAGNPVDLQVGPDGALYVLAPGGAAPGVYRIAPLGGGGGGHDGDGGCGGTGLEPFAALGLIVLLRQAFRP